jgi:hypothetical protein
MGISQQRPVAQHELHLAESYAGFDSKKPVTGVASAEQERSSSFRTTLFELNSCFMISFEPKGSQIRCFETGKMFTSVHKNEISDG